MNLQLRQDFKYLSHVLSFLKPWRWRYIFGTLVNSSSAYIYNLLVALLIGNLLETAQRSDLNNIGKVTATSLGWIILFLIINAIGIYQFKYASTNAVSVLRRDLYKHMLYIPVDNMPEKHTGDQLSRLDSDIAYSARLFQYALQKPITTIITFISGAITVFAVSWQCGLSLIILGTLMLYINTTFIVPNRKRYGQRQNSMANTVMRMSDLLAGAQMVRIYGENTGMLKGFIDSCMDLQKRAMSAFHLRTLQNGLGQIQAALTTACSIGIGLILFNTGHVSLGELPLLFNMGTMIVNPIASFGEYLSSIQEDLAGAKRIVEVLEIPEEYIIKKQKIEIKSNYAVEAKHLTFSYEEDKMVLNDISFKQPVKQVWAIVGLSGSGKSTLLKLLMGISPYIGTLKLFGNEVRELSPDVLRNISAYVPQDCPLFEGTIYQNILMGRLNATRDEVERAAHDADVDSFVREFTDGYKTQVGERGVQLSGGQRQRIAIARALLKNAPLLLLDEVTASLDSITEYHIKKALSILMEGRTTIIIAHRLSTIINADNIIVLNKGKIIEQGTHDRLINMKGTYAHLYYLQIGEGLYHG